ncbi:MAG: type IV secretory system conjugative DNA transfer family protein [Clostridia bacterium]|nr:type IV secretory system conjugative DNA transfer family protein [Clostridia bacterium]
MQPNNDSFASLQNDDDIQKTVYNLLELLLRKDASPSDPFWKTSASMLLMAIVFYLHYEAREDEQNFAMVMDMLRYGALEDEDSDDPSPLDMLFDELEKEKPEHIAVKYYRGYKACTNEKADSVRVSLIERLEKVKTSEINSLFADSKSEPSNASKATAKKVRRKVCLEIWLWSFLRMLIQMEKKHALSDSNVDYYNQLANLENVVDNADYQKGSFLKKDSRCFELDNDSAQFTLNVLNDLKRRLSIVHDDDDDDSSEQQAELEKIISKITKAFGK